MIPAKVWAWGIAIVIVAVIGFSIDRHARQDALAELRDSTYRARLDSSAKVGDSLRTVFRRDTLRIFRSLHTVDTMIQHRIDTAVVRQTDTVTFTIREAVAIQDTIKACKALVLTCAQRADNAEGQIALWESRYNNLNDRQPGFLRRHLSAGVGYCAVVHGGMVLTGPCASIGLRWWP